MSALYQMEIRTPDQPVGTLELSDGVYALGRGAACKIKLTSPSVSERHALLIVRVDGIQIKDLGSSNGTYVNGKKVDEARVPAEAVIRLGMETELRLYPAETGTPVETAPVPRTNRKPAPVITPEPVVPEPVHEPDPAPKASAHNAPRDLHREIKYQIQQELIQRLDIKRLSASRVNNEELQRRARETIDAIIQDVKDRLPAGIDPHRLAVDIYNEALRLGPIEDLLADDTVSEIMINGPHQVYVERKGKLERTDQDFMDEASVHAIIERIVAPIGRRIDESQPYVDARLPDGSRVNAIIPPLSLTGPCVTIRKFSRRALTDVDLIRFGTWSRDMVDFLRICVLMRKNIVVSGGTGSGKTTLLNVLSNFLPATDRIVTIEDAAELRLAQPHLVRLEARPANIEGRGAITIRDLVRNALRMRPDRIIVGECRGGEALDMLQAMNTGHDGSLTTVHANSPRDVIARLETMVLMSGMDLPSRAIREQVASAVDLIVHESRCSDGSRKVTVISEIMGMEGNQIVMQDLFEFKQTGLGEGGKVLGDFQPTGAMPGFFDDLKSRGLTLDPSIFSPARREHGGRA